MASASPFWQHLLRPVFPLQHSFQRGTWLFRLKPNRANVRHARLEDPTYRTETEDVLKRQASERIEIIPAKYEIVEEQVLVRAAFEEEQIVPAQFETVAEPILVKPASTRWKKGRGLVEKVNNITGEIMCLEVVQAEYKTVTKQIVKAPARKKLVQVPAEYKTVRVNKLITPATEKRIPVPAEYQTVTKTIKESEGRMVWRRCCVKPTLRNWSKPNLHSPKSIPNHDRSHNKIYPARIQEKRIGFFSEITMSYSTRENGSPLNRPSKPPSHSPSPGGERKGCLKSEEAFSIIQ